MTRSTIRRMVLAVVAAPLMIGLAACDSKPGNGEPTSGEPIAKIAPPAGKSWTDIATKTDEGGYLMGNPEAPIKLVEFASLTCPHCAEFTARSGEELQNFVASGRVSYEFRNFVMNPLDLTMAMMVRCGAPESFYALTEQTFANQAAILDRWSNAGEAVLSRAVEQPANKRYQAIAEVVGLPEFYAARGIAKAQASACLAEDSTAETLVKTTQKQAEQFNITGTPSFLINGQKVDMNTWPEIKARLEAMGAR